jgi:protein-tyrosine kinase
MDVKHSPASLLERAAELYGFAPGLPAPAAEPEPAAEPVLQPEPEARPQAEKVDATQPAPARSASAPAAARSERTVALDRHALAQAGFLDPDGAVTGLAEEYRLIKRQLLGWAGAGGERDRCILVCSAQPGEGKTFSAINLALSLSGERDLEVLLVDADFTKPEVLAKLGVEGGPGLVDALADPLADPERFVIKTDIRGLSLLPSGRKANNVPELIASERTRVVLDRLLGARPRRIILFDSPPALMASVANVLAGHVGQALLVVRADRTTEADVREATELLSGAGRIGLMLNAAAFGGSRRRYGGYYGGEDEA